MGLVVFLLACITHPLRADNNPVPPPVRIEMPVLVDELKDLEFFQTCARAYEQVHPGVRIDVSGDPMIGQKVRVRILEGAPPEITYGAGVDYPRLIRTGHILALDAYLDGPNWEGDATWRESFLPGALDLYRYDGKTYGIPLMYAVSTVWYNRKLFEAHGWAPPRTWDQFIALCEAIRDTGFAPLAFQGRHAGNIRGVIEHLHYHLAGREAFYAQQQLVPGSFRTPEFLDTLTRIQHLALNHFQTGAMGMSHTEAQLAFFRGDAAMIISGPWLKGFIDQLAPEGFEYALFPLPVPESPHADPGATRVYTVHFFVMAGSRYPEQAADFLRFMTSRQKAGLAVRTRQIPSAIRGANVGNLPPELDELVALMQRTTTTFGDGPGSALDEMSQPWSDVRFRLLSGTISPREAVEQLEDAAAILRARRADPDHLIVNHRFKGLVLLAVLTLGALFGVVGVIRKPLKWPRRKSLTSESAMPRMARLDLFAFLFPAAGLYLLFMLGPSMVSFIWSLTRWDGLSEMRLVGLLNFKRLLIESDAFWIALGNNLFIMTMVPGCVIPLALFLAARLNSRVRGAAFYRVVYFFPNLLGIVSILLWMQLYNPQGGPINRGLVALGFERFEAFPWLSQSHLYWALIPMFIWTACGFHLILYLAAMQGIPRQLYEAAQLDGASDWHQFWAITLPLVRPVLAVSVAFLVIAGMKTFEPIWLLTDQRPTTQVHVIGTLMVTDMFVHLSIGAATAVAVVLFLMVFVATGAVLRVLNRDQVELA